MGCFAADDSTEKCLGGGGLDGSERWGRLKEQLLEKLTMKIKVFLNYLCHFSVGTTTLVLRQFPPRPLGVSVAPLNGSTDFRELRSNVEMAQAATRRTSGHNIGQIRSKLTHSHILEEEEASWSHLPHPLLLITSLNTITPLWFLTGHPLFTPSLQPGSQACLCSSLGASVQSRSATTD